MNINRNLVWPMLVLGAISFSSLTLVACDDKGPAEKAGKQVDKAASDAKKALDNATK